MIRNYLAIAWRQLTKNKLYAAINVLGLVVGLAVYLFGSLLVDYERNHDTFYENSSRIFTAGSLFSATANVGVNETDGIYTAFAPFIRAEIESVDAVARTVGREFLVSIDDAHFYETVRFADPELLTIFDFDYLEGDARALDDPSGIVLTRSVATKFFGPGPALDRVVTLDHGVSLRVTGVIADLPPNTHFRSTLIGQRGFEVLAPLEALNRANGYDLAGNFNNLSLGDFTYMLVREGTSREDLQASIDGVYDRHFPERTREFITGVKVRPLVEANTILWDAIGLPVLDSVRILAFLVLVVAIVNYTNLATAQSLGRSREIGLRKTMGASRRQLVTQFLVESLCVAGIAMLIALAMLEATVPAFNNALDCGLAINYASILPWLVATTLAVGVVAGSYPAYLITRASPIDALRDGGGKSAGGGAFRTVMLVLQFSISIFMLAMVLVVFFQNKKIEDASQIYPKSQIITLQRLDVDAIQSRLETLGNELNTLPGVENVTFSSLVPYEQSNSSFDVGTESGNQDSAFLLTEIAVDEHFLATYDIDVLAGRNLSASVTADTSTDGMLAVNVIINELASARLGFGSPPNALGRVFYDFPEEREPRTYTVVGVIPDQNFQGFHNQIKPTMFHIRPDEMRYGSIRVRGAGLGDTLTHVESVWETLIPDYPIQSRFLEAQFNETFQIYSAMTFVLGGFAFVALALSMIGLFGLAAFMAEARTKEIGVRKVMGASVAQIARLLIWQFSKPVLWALLIGLPLAYFASSTYLNFFADRIGMPGGIVAGAGALAVLFAWAVVAVHAVRIAQANPIKALRYE